MEEENPKTEEEPKKKDSVVIYAIAILLILIALVIIVPRFYRPHVDTLDELHEKNLQGKLAPDKGYMYNGIYSFVLFDDLWYTQLRTSDGSNLFNIPFHYSPRDVEHITPVGQFNYSNLNNYQNFFMTFDPTDEDLAHIAASISETNMIFIQAFGKGVIAACTNDKDLACKDRPIVQCNSTDAPVFYYASEPETDLIYLNNCAIISGTREELFKATDRMLFDLLDIMQ
jgi:hypothetical protein